MPPLIETLFQLPESIFPTPLKLYSAGITHPDPNYRIHREKPNLTVLEYIVSGEGHLVIDGRRYHIKAGDVYLLHPFTDQDYASDRLNPWEKIWFNLSGPLIGALCDAYRLRGIVYFHDCRLEKEFFEAAELLRKRPQAASGEFALLIHRIIAGIDLWRKEHPETRKSPEGVHLKEYLDTNWRKKVSLCELAGEIHKSEAQTLRIFRRDWNCTPYAYLQEQRSFLARQYLENSDYPVKILAEMLGFNDEFYFSNWFKEKNGCSPRSYRRRFRELQ